MKHMNSKHEEHNKKVCNVCDKKFLTSEMIRDHLDTAYGANSATSQHESSILTCDKCGKICKSSSKLQDHLRRYHFERTPCGNYLSNDTD